MALPFAVLSLESCRMSFRFPAVPAAPPLRQAIEQVLALPEPDQCDAEFVAARLGVPTDVAQDYLGLLKTFHLVSTDGEPTNLFAGARECRPDALGVLAQELLACYSRLFDRITNAHRLNSAQVTTQFAQMLGVHHEHESAVDGAVTFASLVEFVGPQRIDEALGVRRKPKRRDPILVLLAKATGLAILVLLLASVFELIAGRALGYDLFRGGITFAYIAAASVLIAFSKSEETLNKDAFKAGMFTLVGIVIWAIIDLDVRGFEVLSALTGIWYTVLIRRV